MGVRQESKRDFIFIDESGDAGADISVSTPYYIVSLVHLTDYSIRKLAPHIGALRYFGFIQKELKSTSLSVERKEQILEIIEFVKRKGIFVTLSAVYVDKAKYKGPYLDGNSKFFRNLMIRRLLEFHFEIVPPQTNEIELILDRMYPSEEDELRLRVYLRKDKHGKLPLFNYIIQADSRYLDWLQLADWVSGIIKDIYFKRKASVLNNIQRYRDLINIKEILY